MTVEKWHRLCVDWFPISLFDGPPGLNQQRISGQRTHSCHCTTKTGRGIPVTIPKFPVLSKISPWTNNKVSSYTCKLNIIRHRLWNCNDHRRLTTHNTPKLGEWMFLSLLICDELCLKAKRVRPCAIVGTLNWVCLLMQRCACVCVCVCVSYGPISTVGSLSPPPQPPGLQLSRLWALAAVGGT